MKNLKPNPILQTRESAQTELPHGGASKPTRLYVPPAILHELELETRAGSVLSDPLDWLED